jgi:hypothetical protein
MTAIHVLSNAAPDGIVPPVCGPRARHMIVSNFILDNPEHWLQRAEEARSIAEELSDPELRRMSFGSPRTTSGSQLTPAAERRAGWRS